MLVRFVLRFACQSQLTMVDLNSVASSSETSS